MLFVHFLLLASALAQNMLDSKHIILGGGGGSFPLDDGRTLDAIDLFTERGYKVEFQKYWLTSLPAGGSEWQPSWFQNALAAEKGKTVPVFIVYYVPHLFFPNWNDHSNPLPYDTALSPANQAAYLAYIDRFGDFAATLTGDVYVTLEPEYNIVVPLQTEPRYSALMSNIITRLRAKVAGSPAVKLHIGAGYMLADLLEFGARKWFEALPISLAYAPQADYFGPIIAHNDAAAYTADDDKTGSQTVCTLHRYTKWAAEAWPGMRTIISYHLAPTPDATTDQAKRTWVNVLSAKSRELHTLGLRAVGNWGVLDTGTDNMMKGTQSNGKWVTSSIVDKVWSQGVIAWSQAQAGSDFVANPYTGPDTCLIPAFDRQHIYTDALAPGWSDASFSVTVVYNDATHAQGAAAISVAPQAFGGFRMSYSGFGNNYPNKEIHTTEIASVEFMVFSPSGTVPPTKLSVSAAAGALVSTFLPTLPANTWTRVSIPMSAIEPTDVSIQFVMLKSQASVNEKYWIDNFQFVLKSQPTTAVATTRAATTAAATTVAAATTTAAPAATTTIHAGGTTVPATTKAATTAPAGATTAAATTAAAGATTAARTTTAALTTAAAGASTTASGATTAPAGAPCGYAVCCTMGSLPLPAQYTRFTLKLSTTWSQFNCESFMTAFAQDASVPPSQVVVLSVTSGSTIIDAAVPDTSAAAFAGVVQTGRQTVPNVVSFSTPTGTTVPPAAFPWWIILIVVIFVLLAVAILVVICIYRRRQRNGFSKDYVAISDMAPRSNYAASPSNYAVYAQTPPAPAVASAVRAKLLFDVQDHGENVLPARQGDIALVLPEDLAATSDWIFVKIADREGYVPRNFLSPV